MPLDPNDPAYAGLREAIAGAIDRVQDEAIVFDAAETSTYVDAVMAAILPVLDPYDGEHVVDVDAWRRWTMTHTLACRLGGHMADCLHHAAVRAGGAPATAGRYSVRITSGSLIGYHFDPID